MQFIAFVFALLGAYLLGSLSSAILVCRLLRLPDPRLHGSHNPGTTNVLRLGGKFAAALTLLGDLIKGWLPVFVAKFFTSDPWYLSFILLAAIVGHIYPIFFKFKGGKGIATAIGGFLAISPLLGGIYIGIWLIIFGLTRYSSLAGLSAMISIPFIAGWLLDLRYLLGLGLLAMLVIWRHRENIKRLLNGQEQKFNTTLRS